MSRSRYVALGFLLVTVTLAACGRTGTTTNEATERKPEPRSASENQVNAQPRDRVQDGGRLVWPIESMPVTWNYGHLDGTDHDASYSKLATLPVAFYTDASGTPYYNRVFLASEPSLVTEPKQVVTYVINPKAIWYDGTPITWEDFHWQWRAQNGTNKAYQISSSNGYADIENVARGRDDREVVVTFRNRFADWQSVFSPVYPASMSRSPDIYNNGWKQRPLNAAGPFKVDRIDQTAKTVTLVRNEKWWGPPAKLEQIVFRTISIDAQVDALANGEIDLMDIGPDVNKFQRARAVSGAEIRAAGGPNFRHITINGTGAILSDVRVRRAFAMAIDRAAIARAMLGPLGIDATPLGNHIFMANQAGYRDNSGEVGKYDTARAAQLLEEAGWTMQGDVRRKGGRVLEITCVIPAGVPVSRQESELIQNMVAQVGIRLNINTVPSPDFFEKYVRPGQFDVTLFSWIGTPFPISSSRSIYAKPVAGPGGELAIQQNYSRVGSDEIDRLYAQANQELDRQKAIDIANQIDSLIWQEVHSLTLYQRPELWATKRGIANHGAFGFAEIVYEDIGWMKQ